jgi:hypothetical protein
MRRALIALLLALTVAGCAGGTPEPAQVKAAARDWATHHLAPQDLRVTLVAVTPDQRRARVRLVADGQQHALRLVRRGDDWRVAHAALFSHPT